MKVLVAILLVLPFVVALQSPATDNLVSMKVLAINSTTNAYTFQCIFPPGFKNEYHWSSREGDKLETEFSSINSTWTWVLDQPAYYHIGCAGYDANGKWELYDVHVDLREKRVGKDPVLEITGSSGFNISARCTPPADMKRYRLQWTWNSEMYHVSMPQFDNKLSVVVKAPSAHLWELACSVTNLDNFSDWRTDASTIDVFATGPAYIPNRLGCMPWECGVRAPFLKLAWKPAWIAGAVCGNGLLEAGETCDDGNKVAGDGCSSSCALELPVCGDGKVGGAEMCDDGNIVSGDGCSATCAVESTCAQSVADLDVSCSAAITNDTFDGCRHIACGGKKVLACNKEGSFEMYNQGGPANVSICLGETCMSSQGFVRAAFTCAVCGDGRLDADEACDDGNTVSGDGCSASCELECAAHLSDMELTCSGVISADVQDGCRSISCSGKNVLACEKSGFFEMYNKGGNASVLVCLGDVCIDDEGYVKSPAFPICGAVCGDGRLDGVESCDDGNTKSGDGCSASCVVEPYCGDGRIDAGEQCDDGNKLSGDGCSALCVRELRNGTVKVSIAPWFPQGNNVVLLCKTNFTATSYDWEFGDGTTWLHAPRADVWHTYASKGNFSARCSAVSSTQQGTGVVRVKIAG